MQARKKKEEEKKQTRKKKKKKKKKRRIQRLESSKGRAARQLGKADSSRPEGDAAPK